ncbi:hypothetical protein AB0K64_08260 [Streptomyces sp. NPDC053741]|uniref:hypothetical protein n=1 Tax=Streptomyces TaxID=1883 RepID=UPI0002C6D84E|nr:hypothetical protein [Streptomyces sp. PAMC 26508]AGJ56519.1 hypothetical protein F750_4074 [Streptomyces sp. PAMC 26508]MDF9870866.1 hypothetical protein [Streptomyces pratensis]QBR07836.1 hypothetical protein D7Y56_19075 [Streptomyces sp. S501]
MEASAHRTESLGGAGRPLYSRPMIQPTPSTAPVPDAECVALTRTLRRRGTVVLSVFALVWTFAGASGLASPGAALAVEILAVPVTAAAIVLAYRKGAAPSPRVVDLPANWARSVGIVNVVELAAIFAVIAASNASGHPGLIPPCIALVVGLHFVPLARLYDQWQYKGTAALLGAVAVLGLALLAAGFSDESVRAVVGLASAVTLWASAYHVAVKG